MSDRADRESGGPAEGEGQPGRHGPGPVDRDAGPPLQQRGGAEQPRGGDRRQREADEPAEGAARPGRAGEAGGARATRARDSRVQDENSYPRIRGECSIPSANSTFQLFIASTSGIFKLYVTGEHYSLS